MKNILSIVLFLTALLSHLGAIDRTIGGETIQDGDNAQPWLVALNNKGQPACSASLVSDRFLLTANHCVVFSNLTDLTIKARGSEIISKAKNVYFPSADSSTRREADFVVIELETPIALSSYALLPEANTIDKYYDRLDSSILFGYGMNDAISQEEVEKQFMAGAIQPTKLNLSIMDRETCDAKLIKDGVMPSLIKQLICSDSIEDTKRRNKQIGMCAGDSGGPLVVFENNQYTQIGVVSGYMQDGGNPECGYNTGKYANISYHSVWVKSVLNGEVKPSSYDKEEEPLTAGPSMDPLALFYNMLPSMPKKEWHIIGLGVDLSFEEGGDGGYDLDPNMLNSHKNGFSVFTYRTGKWVEYNEDTTEPISLSPFQGAWIYLK